MNIDVNMNEINAVEKIISDILVEKDFNQMNHIVNQKKNSVNSQFLFPNINVGDNTGFIAVKKNSIKPYIKVMTEEEFFEIMEASEKGISSKSGRYQEHLYGCYMQALKNNDEGYISDVLNMALEFKTNMENLKSLIEDKTFAKEWRKDFGSESAIEVLKRKGNMRIVNIIKERAK